MRCSFLFADFAAGRFKNENPEEPPLGELAVLPFLNRVMRLIEVDLPRSRTRVDATGASFMTHVHVLSSCQRRAR